MANYYTRFSLILLLPNEAAQKHAINLVKKANELRFEDPAIPPDAPSDFPADLADMLEDWNFEAESRHAGGPWELWLHSENGGIDAVCAFIQHLLKKFDPKGRVAFEWSHDCSQPRVDAYGGGAALITARKIKSMNTTDWLRKQNAA